MSPSLIYLNYNSKSFLRSSIFILQCLESTKGYKIRMFTAGKTEVFR